MFGIKLNKYESLQFRVSNWFISNMYTYVQISQITNMTNNYVITIIYVCVSIQNVDGNI